MIRSLNLCDLPPWALASREFQRDPVAITLQGLTSGDLRFFAQLDIISERTERAALFQDYVSVKFCLNQASEGTAEARRAIKNSYLRFLRGWAFDSNSPEGAVLKGWVESRFGIRPLFHKQPLTEHDEDYSPYDLDRTRGIARTNSIYSQFDLLYTFCQYELKRAKSDRRWLTLFRGTYDAREHFITERTDRRHYFVRINNLTSFTSEIERAWEFGTTVWRVEVPVAKIMFHHGILPLTGIEGEDEYLVVGGEYQVEEVWG